ncbi:MAG: VOC family protein [Cyanobacteriota bacterium]|nr:VOC family protein [Cyanobacteriota bacterium]
MSQITLATVSAMNPKQISWVLASHDPGRLRLFYEALLNRQASQGLSPQHWTLPLAEGLDLELYRPSRSRSFPERGRCLSLCLRLEASPDPLVTLTSLLPDLQGAGAAILEPPRRESFGAECWLRDPEGNSCLVVVPFDRGASDPDAPDPGAPDVSRDGR